MLKKAYLKAAMKAHPDRGGSPQAFQQVSIAFTILQKKLKDLFTAVVVDILLKVLPIHCMAFPILLKSK